MYRDRTVNMILQTFQTVYRVQYEQLRPSNVSKPFRSLIGYENVQERFTVVTLNGQERLETFESGRSNLLGRIVGKVRSRRSHSKTADQLYRPLL